MSGVVVEGGCDTVEELAVKWFAINSAELLGRFMVSYIHTYNHTIVEGERSNSQTPLNSPQPHPSNYQSPKFVVALLTPTKGPAPS